MNDVERALFRQISRHATQRGVRVDLLPLPGDIWAGDHPEEAKREEEIRQEAIKNSLQPQPDGSIRAIPPPLTTQHALNMQAMLHELYSLREKDD